MKLFNLLSKTLFITSLFMISAISVAQTDDDPDPEGEPEVEGPQKGADFKITGLRYSGNGCPKDNGQDSASLFATNSKPGGGVDYFQATFDDFIVTRPGSEKKTPKDVKKCTITFNIDHPKGMRFKLDSVEFDGYAEIAKKHKGIFKAVYYFNKNDNDSKKKKRKAHKEKLKGGYEGDYKFNLAFEFWDSDKKKGKKKKLWTPCNRKGKKINYNIQTTLTLKGHSKDLKAESMLTADIQSGLFQQKFKMKWVKCKKKI